jgi:hypothetical protein
LQQWKQLARARSNEVSFEVFGKLELLEQVLLYHLVGTR